MSARFREGNVVVITGASTGIGRATALAFAERGARFVLVARQKEKLDELARACAKIGSESITVSLDVNDAPAVRGLAEEAVKRFGRIDVWVNNAGIGVIGSFTDVPLEEHRRVIETNLLGYINGAYAALSTFRRQRFGTLINNASISARLTTPYLASYTASKWGIRGLTHSLRQDVAMGDYGDVAVCQINPGVVDTPAFQHAGNFSGLPLKIKFPMTTPDRIASAIVGLADYPRREIFVGPLTHLGAIAYTLFPALTAGVLTLAMRSFYLSAEKGKPAKEGNAFGPVRDESKKDGGWKEGAVAEA
jgi:short-subunit dehydrogenase